MRWNPCAGRATRAGFPDRPAALATPLGPRRRPSRGAAALIAPLALSLAALGCSPPGAPGPTAADAASTPAAAPVRKVEAVPCRIGPVRDVLSVSTTLEALQSVDVPALVPGRVAEVLVREGDFVRAGDPLLRLADDELRLAARERELEHRDAVERAATAQIDWQESQRAEEVQQLAFEKAEREFRRLELLLAEAGRRPVSEESLDAARFSMEQARIQKETGALVTRRKDLARNLAELAVEKSRASWERAQLDLARAAVSSPIDGDVTWIELRPGEPVVSGAHVATVVDRGELFCSVRIPQRRFADLSLGRPVEIEAETHPGRVFGGRVEAILAVVDPVEGTIEARVAVEDPQGELRPGAFLTARVILNERPEALLVPKRARLFEGNRSLLFVVREDKAVRLEIDTGLLTEGEVEVLPASGGLLPDDLVIVRGQSRLRDGEAVAIAPSIDDPALPAESDDPSASEGSESPGAPSGADEAGAATPDAPPKG